MCNLFVMFRVLYPRAGGGQAIDESGLRREGTHLRFPEDESMAIMHAELRPAGHALEVVDKSARAGTFVALPQGGERKVPEGTRIRLGATVFRVMVR